MDEAWIKMTRTAREQSDRIRARKRSDLSSTWRRPALQVIHEKHHDHENRFPFLNQDTTLEIHDSHAVDYSRYANVDETEEVNLNALLPFHLRKTKVKERNGNKKKRKDQTVCDEESTSDLSKDFEQKLLALELTSEKEDDHVSLADYAESKRRFSISSRKFSTDSFLPRLQTDTQHSTHDTRQSTHDTRHSTHDTRQSTHDTRHSTHDTLTSFLKHYREKRNKDKRLRKVQSQAKVKTTKSEQRVTKTSTEKGGVFLPLLEKKQYHDVKGRPRDDSISDSIGLPKIKRERRKTANAPQDPKKLVSSLAPVYSGEPTTKFPVIMARKT